MTRNDYSAVHAALRRGNGAFIGGLEPQRAWPLFAPTAHKMDRQLRTWRAMRNGEQGVYVWTEPK